MQRWIGGWVVECCKGGLVGGWLKLKMIVFVLLRGCFENHSFTIQFKFLKSNDQMDVEYNVLQFVSV